MIFQNIILKIYNKGSRKSYYLYILFLEQMFVKFVH